MRGPTAAVGTKNYDCGKEFVLRTCPFRPARFLLMGASDGHVRRALVDDRAFDVARRDDRLIVNGEAKEPTFEVLLVLEATKMEIELTVPLGEGVHALRATSGDAVGDATLLIEVDTA